MINSPKPETLAQWKERAREFLKTLAVTGIELSKKGQHTPRKDSTYQKIKYKTVFDPIAIKLEDTYGGVFTCSYDIRLTLVGLCKKFQEHEDASDDEIISFAETENISRDEAMARIAMRYLEAEMFSKIKAAKFLHNQLQPALKELLDELLDEAYLQGALEYGIELIEPAKIFEMIGREHIKQRKKRSGLVRAPGHPRTWNKEELLVKVRTAMQKQKRMPTLLDIAKTLKYGSLNDGASALGKLLKRHSIEWKEIRKEWKETQKRT
jgi:hypothetical protein